jgi:aryl-alcohol dehydrogenase-like predicted oxidoreductase
MIYRKLGRTHIMVSALGLGGSTFGGGLYFRDEAAMLRVVDTALEAGITFFDTSNSYGEGASEALFGKALRTRRSAVVLATKGGLNMSRFGRLAMAARPLLMPLRPVLRHFRRELNVMRDGQKSYSYTPAEMRRNLEGSLRRLQTDYVDLYQFYNVSASTVERDDLFDVMLRFKDEGKVRACGLTVVFPDPLEKALRYEALESIQLAANMLDHAVLRTIIPRAAARGVGVIARSPLAQGLLTNAEGHVMAFETSHRSLTELQGRRRQAEALRILQRPGRTLAQAALRYVLQHEGVSTVLFSVTSEAQLTENLGALECGDLEPQELAVVERSAAAAPLVARSA